MNRRKFIGLVSGAAVAWPPSVRGQQIVVRRISAIVSGAADDPDAQAYAKAFNLGLRDLGWTDGQNIKIDYRWATGDLDRLRSDVADTVSQAPEVILSAGTQPTIAIKAKTSTIPIVFVHVADPLTGGLVQSLACPNENVTGFAAYESSIGGKWLELLKEIAPGVTQVLVLIDPQNPTWRMHVPTIEAVAPSLSVQLTLAHIRSAAEIEPTIKSFAA
jgi:ABC-type uncharacterized transport system substrate-binding protein